MQSEVSESKSITRRTSSGLSKSEKWRMFPAALEQAIKAQSKKQPEAFHPELLNHIDAYSKQFSKHLINKVESRSVIVMNETVAAALKSLDIEPSLKELYKLAAITLPDFDAEAFEEPKKQERVPFRGC